MPDDKRRRPDFGRFRSVTIQWLVRPTFFGERGDAGQERFRWMEVSIAGSGRVKSTKTQFNLQTAIQTIRQYQPERNGEFRSGDARDHHGDRVDPASRIRGGGAGS